MWPSYVRYNLERPHKAFDPYQKLFIRWFLELYAKEYLIENISEFVIRDGAFHDWRCQIPGKLTLYFITSKH